MSDSKYFPEDIDRLTQRLQSSERSIVFIQREHASTLNQLHEELAKWQKKCADLTFQIAMAGLQINVPNDQNEFLLAIEQLEKELSKCKEQIEVLNKNLKEKEKLQEEYKNRLIDNERKFALELRIQHEKQRELQNILNQRAIFISQLTEKLNREKQKQSSSSKRIARGTTSTATNPLKAFPIGLNVDEQQSQFIRINRPIPVRSSSLANKNNAEYESTKILCIGRRPPTPPQQLGFSSTKIPNLSDEPNQKISKQWTLNHGPTNNNPKNSTLIQRTETKMTPILPPISLRRVPLRPGVTTLGTSNSRP